jgi:hypothetical protein
MIDRETKAAWITALRSGDYKQTQEALCDDVGYCCLGVLAEVMTGPGAWNESNYHDNLAHPLQEPLSEMLQDDVLPEKVQSILSEMNDGGNSAWDGEPKTFAEIADWIEANLEVK